MSEENENFTPDVEPTLSSITTWYAEHEEITDVSGDGWVSYKRRVVTGRSPEEATALFHAKKGAEIVGKYRIPDFYATPAPSPTQEGAE